MPDILKGQVAIVTGAGNGIGSAEAMGLASQGAKVVVNDLGTTFDGEGASAHPADQVVDEINKAGGTAVANHNSVAAEEGANGIIQCALDNFGRLDILINNAGIVRNQPIYDINTQDWDAVVKTHLYGTFFCTRAASKVMKQQGYGRIVCTSSHIGLGFQGQPTYSAVKEGIVGFARSVARDMGRYGTTCNVIRPIAAWRGSPFKDSYMEQFRPEDVAVLVVYLASKAADNINGCIFEVWKGHVGIFVDPPPVAQVVWKDGSWTTEELARVLPETLTGDKKREEFPSTMSFKFPRS